MQLKPSAAISKVEIPELLAIVQLPSFLSVPPAKTQGAEALQVTHGDIAVDALDNGGMKIAWNVVNIKLPIGDKPATLKGTLMRNCKADELPSNATELINNMFSTVSDLKFSSILF